MRELINLFEASASDPEELKHLIKNNQMGWINTQKELFAVGMYGHITFFTETNPHLLPEIVERWKEWDKEDGERDRNYQEFEDNIPPGEHPGWHAFDDGKDYMIKECYEIAYKAGWGRIGTFQRKGIKYLELECNFNHRPVLTEIAQGIADLIDRTLKVTIVDRKGYPDRMQESVKDIQLPYQYKNIKETLILTPEEAKTPYAIWLIGVFQKNKEDKNYMNKALNLLKKFKMKFTKKYSDDFSWSGKKLSLGTKSQNEVLHELAHWLLAVKERRFTPEFGLGPGFDTGDFKGAEKRQVTTSEQSLDEEHKTCVLEHVIMADLGASFNEVMHVLGVENFVWGVRKQAQAESQAAIYGGVSKYKHKLDANFVVFKENLVVLNNAYEYLKKIGLIRDGHFTLSARISEGKKFKRNKRNKKEGAWNKAEQHTKYDPPNTGNKGKSARPGFVG